MMRAKTDFMRWYELVVSSLQRNVRECSLPQLLLLLYLECYPDGASTLALVRRLQQCSVVNPRQVLLRARERCLVYCRQEGDGLVWRMTDEGEVVLRRAIERIMPRKA